MSETRECAVCWWVYDPAAGDEDFPVPAGTSFEALPEGYRCPRCDAPPSRFVRPRAEEPADDPRPAALVGAYERIFATKMVGLPVVNPRLAVEAVDFAAIADGALAGALFGALVTPWSINAVLFPPPGPEAPARGRLRAFPSGEFLFFPQRLPEIGVVEICSIFSPALEFEDQAAAVAAARAALALIGAPDEAPSRTRRALFDALRGGR